MIAAIEREDLVRYQQCHSHSQRTQKKKLALLSSTVVLVAMVLIVARGSVLSAFGIQPSTPMIEHAGGVQLTTVKLMTHVPLPMHAGHTRFWLGPIPGYTYTTNCVTPGVLKVGYFESGHTLQTMPYAKILISAFASEDVYKANPHPLRIDSEIQTVNSKGDVVTYRESDMTTFTIRRHNTGEIIEITYTDPKTFSTMMNDSERLITL